MYNAADHNRFTAPWGGGRGRVDLRTLSTHSRFIAAWAGEGGLRGYMSTAVDEKICIYILFSFKLNQTE